MNEQDYLMHYGVKGMKWGVRRYQNPDGTRTALGRQHEAELKGRSGSSLGERARSTASKVKSALTSDKAKKAYKVAGVAIGVAAVATAAYMYGRNKGAVDAAVKNLAGRAVSSTSAAAKKGKQYLSKAIGKASVSARAAADNAAVNFENSKVGKAAKKAVRSVGMNAAATADIAKNKARAAGSAIKNSQAARSAYGAATKAGSAVKGAASNLKETARAAKQDYDMNYRGTGKQMAKNAASAVKGAAKRAGQATAAAGSSAAKAGKTYVNNAGRAVSNAAKKVNSKYTNEQWIMKGAKSSPTPGMSESRRSRSGGMSRITEGTRYGEGYNPTAKGSKGASWITRGAKSSPTTNKTAMDAYSELYKKTKKKK